MVDSTGRNPFQCALAGVYPQPMSRRDCWVLMENLARLYPPDANVELCTSWCPAPDSFLASVLLKDTYRGTTCTTPDEDGFLLLHTPLNRPPKATLGTRKPLADGHLVDVALMLIDRFQQGTVMKAGPLKLTPLALLAMTWRGSAPRDGDPDYTAGSESTPGNSGGTGYSSSYSSYFAHHGRGR